MNAALTILWKWGVPSTLGKRVAGPSMLYEAHGGSHCGQMPLKAAAWGLLQLSAVK